VGIEVVRYEVRPNNALKLTAPGRPQVRLESAAALFCREEEPMPQRDSKVVGYFAYFSPTQVVCTDEDACVVSGSREAMEAYLAEAYPHTVSKATVKKTRFGEILRGLQLSAAYGFDRESYARFYPLAIEAGLPVAAADFDDAKSHEMGRFFTVRLVVR